MDNREEDDFLAPGRSDFVHDHDRDQTQRGLVQSADSSTRSRLPASRGLAAVRPKLNVRDATILEHGLHRAEQIV